MKQLPVNFTLILLGYYEFIVGARLLSDVLGSLIALSDNPLDFLDKIVLVLLFNLKYLNNG